MVLRIHTTSFEEQWIYSGLFLSRLSPNFVLFLFAMKNVSGGVVQTRNPYTEEIISSNQLKVFCKTLCFWCFSDCAGVSIPDNGSLGVLFPLCLAEKCIPCCLQTKCHILCLSIYLLEIRHSTHLCGLSFICKLWSYFTLWPDEQFCGL